jgi:glucose dehydrogenase
MLQKPDPAHWLMWRRTLDSWGYSPLDQVNRSNVNQLRMVWSRGMGSGTSVSGYPITFAAGGKQYVAVSTGASLVAGSVMTLTPELKPGSGSQMFVFALP